MSIVNSTGGPWLQASDIRLARIEICRVHDYSPIKRSTFVTVAVEFSSVRGQSTTAKIPITSALTLMPWQLADVPLLSYLIIARSSAFLERALSQDTSHSRL